MNATAVRTGVVSCMGQVSPKIQIFRIKSWLKQCRGNILRNLLALICCYLKGCSIEIAKEKAKIS